MYESAPVFLLKLGLFCTLTVHVWQLYTSPYTFLARQSHFRQFSQKSFEQRKEMTLDCGLTLRRRLFAVDIS